MGSANAGYEYQGAESEYLNSKTLDDKIHWLQEMIRFCPRHKSSEKMLAELKTRLIKFREKVEKAKKSGKTTREGIKKSDMQAAVVGFAGAGKSSVFKALTGVNAKISSAPYTTTSPEVGMMKHDRVQVQIVDMPPFPNTDTGIVNNTDTLLLVVDNLDQIVRAEQFLKKAKAPRVIVFNKSDLLSEEQKRKIFETLRTKKQNFILFSAATHENLPELKKKIFETFPIIRVYTKEPKKSPSEEPVIMKPNSTVKEIAEKILKGLSARIKRARIWGPSSKFPSQVVGMDHILKDGDVVEFQTT